MLYILLAAKELIGNKNINSKIKKLRSDKKNLKKELSNIEERFKGLIKI